MQPSPREHQCIMPDSNPGGKIMADLFAISNAVIDEAKGIDEVGPINRLNHQLSEHGAGIAIADESTARIEKE